MEKIIEFLVNNPYLTIIGVTCIIQISPLEINPWTKLGGWIRKVIIGDLQAKVNEIDEKMNLINSEITEDRVQRKRGSILNFSNACRQNINHTKEEWDHCIDELKWYETYCEEHNIPNGVIEETSKWLKARYSEHLKNDDFLKD